MRALEVGEDMGSSRLNTCGDLPGFGLSHGDDVTFGRL
jgi:hypothetical protein